MLSALEIGVPDSPSAMQAPNRPYFSGQKWYPCTMLVRMDTDAAYENIGTLPADLDLYIIVCVQRPQTTP